MKPGPAVMPALANTTSSRPSGYRPRHRRVEACSILHVHQVAPRRRAQPRQRRDGTRDGIASMSST